MESESVISEAVLNRALRQDVLYMLMFLPHTHTHTYTHTLKALLRFLIKHYCPLLPYWKTYPAVTMTTEERGHERGHLMLVLIYLSFRFRV